MGENGQNIYPCFAQGSVEFRYEANIIGANGEPVNEWRKNGKFKGDWSGVNICLVKHEDLKNIELGLLHNDKLTIRIEVTLGGEVKKETPDTSLKLVKDFSTMFLSPTHSDFLVTCKEVQFNCHKNVLSCRSPVFLNMLNSNMVESDQSKVVIDDFTPETVKGMLEYIYTGRVDHSQAGELIAAADKYDLEELKNIFEYDILESLSTVNVVDWLFLAPLFRLTKLKANALSLISKNEGILKQGNTVSKLKNNPGMKKEVMKAVYDENPLLVAKLAMEGSSLFK